MKNIIYLFVFTLVFTSCGDDPFSKVKTENVEQAAVRDNTPSKFPVMTFDKKVHDFVGPVCETTDKFLSVKGFQNMKEKEFVAISDVGACGASLSSNYNTKPLIAEIIVKNSKARVIRKKQDIKNLLKQ